MAQLYYRQRNAGSHKYPPFLPYDPDPDNGWILEEVTEENIEELQALNDEIALDHSVYRNTKTKRLMNMEDAFVLDAIDKSWRDPAASGSFSGIHWWGADDLRNEGWMQSDCAYSESHYSPGDNEAAFRMIKDALEQSPWKEEEHYSYYYIRGNGGVEGLYLRGWDVEKQEPTDFIRWWMNSDIVTYLNDYIGMARYDQLDGWDEDLFEQPKQTFIPDFDPEDGQHLYDYTQERWRESLEWAFDEFWNVVVDDLPDDEKDEIVDHLRDAELMCDHGGTNEYFVEFTYSREQALYWLSPLVAGMFGYLEPLADIDEDDFMKDLLPAPEREQALIHWRAFYKACLGITKRFYLGGVEHILKRGVPRLDYGILHAIKTTRFGRSYPDKAKVLEAWPIEKLVAMTEELIVEINNNHSEEQHSE